MALFTENTTQTRSCHIPQRYIHATHHHLSHHWWKKRSGTVSRGIRRQSDFDCSLLPNGIVRSQNANLRLNRSTNATTILMSLLRSTMKTMQRTMFGYQNERKWCYPCIPAPNLHHYDQLIRGQHTETSNIYISIKAKQNQKKHLLTGYQITNRSYKLELITRAAKISIKRPCPSWLDLYQPKRQ